MPGLGLGIGLWRRHRIPRGGFDPYAFGAPEVVLESEAVVSQTHDTDLGTWTDASGNGHTFIQGSATAKPHYRTGGQNGYPRVHFDGSDDLLVAVVSPITFAGEFTIITVTKLDASPSLDTLLGNNSAANDFYQFRTAAGTRIDITAAMNFLQTPNRGTGFQIDMATRDGSDNVHFWYNGVVDGGSESDNNEYNLSMLGCDEPITAQNFFGGDVYAIYMWPSALSDVQLALAYSQLTKKYAVG